MCTHTHTHDPILPPGHILRKTESLHQPPTLVFLCVTQKRSSPTAWKDVARQVHWVKGKALCILNTGLFTSAGRTARTEESDNPLLLLVCVGEGRRVLDGNGGLGECTEEGTAGETHTLPKPPEDEGMGAVPSGFTSALNGLSVTKQPSPAQPPL